MMTSFRSFNDSTSSESASHSSKALQLMNWGGGDVWHHRWLLLQDEAYTESLIYRTASKAF